jgi:hypothetical protein
MGQEKSACPDEKFYFYNKKREVMLKITSLFT